LHGFPDCGYLAFRSHFPKQSEHLKVAAGDICHGGKVNQNFRSIINGSRRILAVVHGIQQNCLLHVTISDFSAGNSIGDLLSSGSNTALFNLFGGVLPHLLMQKFDVDALLAAADEMEMMSLIFENLDGFLLFGLYELLYYSLAAVGLILLLVLRKRLFLVPTRDELPRTWRARPMFGNAGVIFALAFCAVLFLMVMINTAQPLI
jgi:hypothetical protein